MVVIHRPWIPFKIWLDKQHCKHWVCKHSSLTHCPIPAAYVFIVNMLHMCFVQSWDYEGWIHFMKVLPLLHEEKKHVLAICFLWHFCFIRRDSEWVEIRGKRRGVTCNKGLRPDSDVRCCDCMVCATKMPLTVCFSAKHWYYTSHFPRVMGSKSPSGYLTQT